MKQSLAVAAVTLVACAAFGAVYAYFSPSLNAVTGETGNKTERMINDSPRKAHVRAACRGVGVQREHGVRRGDFRPAPARAKQVGQPRSQRRVTSIRPIQVC